MRLETFLGLVGDICRGLKANGFERMILINGHGGNAAPLQTLSVALAEEDVWALAFSYWEVTRTSFAPGAKPTMGRSATRASGRRRSSSISTRTSSRTTE